MSTKSSKPRTSKATGIPRQQCKDVPKYWHQLWRCVTWRCYNPRNENYKNYGARGIAVYSAWIDSSRGCHNFYQDLSSTIGEKPSKQHSIDRIDNDRGYYPDNLKWSTPREQSKNRRSVKLTDKQVAQIRQLALIGVRQRVVASVYDAKKPQVSKIVHGYIHNQQGLSTKQCKEASAKRAEAKRDRALKVHELRAQGFTMQKIADKLGYSGNGGVSDILNGRKHPQIKSQFEARITK